MAKDLVGYLLVDYDCTQACRAVARLLDAQGLLFVRHLFMEWFRLAAEARALADRERRLDALGL